MCDSSYPTITIPMDVLQHIQEIFKTKGWTWYEGVSPTPHMIEDAVQEKLEHIFDEPETDWISGGRLCLVPHDWGDKTIIQICVEVGEIEVDSIYDSSPTTKTGDKENV